MGYRSDVVLVVTREAFGDMWREDAETMNTITGYADTITKKDDAVLIVWSYIKWSDFYGEIAKFQNLLNGLDHDHFQFLRLGEDYNDTEERGGYWDNPFETRISRSLDYDTGEPLNLDVFR